MPAEVTSLAQVSGVELLRVPQPTAADFQEALPNNIVMFPSEVNPAQYLQFEFPNGEILPLNGLKAEYLMLLSNTSADNPLLDEVGRMALKKPGEVITKAKLHKRLLNARWELKETFRGYGIGYDIEECLHETSPNEFKKATFLRLKESASESNGGHESPELYANGTPKIDQATNAFSRDQPDPVSPPLPIHQQLRILAEEGKYTYSQIVGILFPNVPPETGRNRLQGPLSQLRSKLFNEGFYIPDGRGKKGGIVAVKRFDNGPVIPESSLPANGTGETSLDLEPQQPVADNVNTSTEEPSSSRQYPKADQEEPDDQPLDDDELENPIKDPIERRAEAKKLNKPKLTFLPDLNTQGRVIAQIEIPGQGKTPQLELTSDEASLFETIFTSPLPYTHEKLEIKMVDVARSNAFDHYGGFERVFNTLNQKLLQWRIGIGFNENRELVLTNASVKPLTLAPIYRDIESDNSERSQNRQRRRQPSHGKLRL